MTAAETRKTYDPKGIGIVTRPGKFEGEAI